MIQHAYHILRFIPCFACDPAISGEQLNRQAFVIHGDADQVTCDVFCLGVFFYIGSRLPIPNIITMRTQNPGRAIIFMMMSTDISIYLCAARALHAAQSLLLLPM